MSERIQRVKEPASVDVVAFCDEVVKDKVGLLQSMFENIYGTSGGTIALRNSVGGHVTITSCSKRIIPLLTPSSAIVKLLIASLKGHILNSVDAGLLSVVVCMYLMDTYSRLQFSRRTIIVANDYISQRVVFQLLEKLAIQADLARASVIPCLIETYLRPKLKKLISYKEFSAICNLAREAFYGSFNATRSKHSLFSPQLYVLQDGIGVTSSCLYKGVLVRFGGGSDDLWKFSRKHPIRTVCFGVSLAGDDCVVDDDVEYLVGDKTSVKNSLLDHMLELVKMLEELKVDLVFSQKVIHPHLKLALSEAKIQFLERLGLRHMGLLLMLTGGQRIGSISQRIKASDLGQLDNITSLQFFKRKYLLFEHNDNTTVSSIFLCHRDPQSLEDLEVVMKGVQSMLEQVMTSVETNILCGGGCWQTALSNMIKIEAAKCGKHWVKELGISRLHLQQLIQGLCTCLEHVAMRTDVGWDHVSESRTGHHWQLPKGELGIEKWAEMDHRCVCGAFGSRNRNFRFLCLEQSHEVSDAEPEVPDVEDIRLMDSFVPHQAALRCALATVSLGLSVATVVVDKN